LYVLFFSSAIVGVADVLVVQSMMMMMMMISMMVFGASYPQELL